MNGRRRPLVVLMLVLLMGTVGPPVARSASGPTCTFFGEVVLAPGVSARPSSGAFGTRPGRDGTYRCSYRFGPARTGRAGIDGRYGTAGADTCADGGEGKGRIRLGDKRADFTFAYSPFSEDGVATGTFRSERFSGTLTLTARNGDCLDSPVTRVHLRGQGTLQR